ncbi:GNAT family N-acetyltransferase [Kineococcus sp. SYSU DK002]|uniref:GNAT family N-acetyltransferase n=1 Tax=Kineococcus sp. SYSU DK002 TaxID=3383123 RepID=UPI003D7CD50C
MPDLFTAHADAWAVLSGARPGGAVARFPGVRAACSGMPAPQYNGADVVDPALADPGEVAAWFARRGTPWAWRVRAGTDWGGELVVRQRLAGVDAAGFAPVDLPAGCAVRVAGAGDLDALAAVDAAAFGGEPAAVRPWFAGQLRTPGVEVVLVTGPGGPLAAAYAVRSDGDAGPAVLLGGVGVVPAARRRGVAAGLSSWALGRAFAAGARFAHLQPDDDAAARVYARLGFVEGPGLEVRAPR